MPQLMAVIPQMFYPGRIPRVAYPLCCSRFHLLFEISAIKEDYLQAISDRYLEFPVTQIVVNDFTNDIAIRF